MSYWRFSLLPRGPVNRANSFQSSTGQKHVHLIDSRPDSEHTVLDSAKKSRDLARTRSSPAGLEFISRGFTGTMNLLAGGAGASNVTRGALLFLGCTGEVGAKIEFTSDEVMI